jgi:hypothetical protein
MTAPIRILTSFFTFHFSFSILHFSVSSVPRALITIMKLTVLSFLTALALSASASAEEGWTSLFNGKDLAGWKSNTATDDKNESGNSVFTVENGELKVSGGRAHLFYVGPDGNAKFKNFEVKAKVKTTAGSNSGFYFHTKYQDTNWPDNGYECQVNSTHKDPKKTGSLYGVINILVLEPGQKEPQGGKHLKREVAPSKDGEWFDYHITVKGKHVNIKVNGETTVDFTEPEGWDPAASKNSAGRKLGEGTFAIQAHDPKSTTYYKDIVVKPLP